MLLQDWVLLCLLLTVWADSISGEKLVYKKYGVGIDIKRDVLMEQHNLFSPIQCAFRAALSKSEFFSTRETDGAMTCKIGLQTVNIQDSLQRTTNPNDTTWIALVSIYKYLTKS
ncbi:hypothetical protein SK128_027250 [Halocaridina rubra]|uniref:Uncharacterized protein n=1 Tax=Halocaridina rubra TaxID=373956 RepID=A0AAN8X412_HALRR